jgi:hypothetical protein
LDAFINTGGNKGIAARRIMRRNRQRGAGANEPELNCVSFTCESPHFGFSLVQLANYTSVLNQKEFFVQDL